MIIIGFFSAKLLSQEFRFQIYEEITERKDFPFPIKPVKTVLLIFTTISIIGIISKNYLIIKALGGFDQYIINPAESRRFILELGTGDTSGVNLLYYKLFSYMGSLVYVCTLIGGALYTIPRSKLISLYPLFASFLAALLTLQRAAFISNYVSWLICAFLFIYYQPTQLQKKAILTLLRQVVYFIFVFVVFSLLILLLRYFFSSPENIRTIINSFYIYIAGNIWLLDTYLVHDFPQLYGLSLFRSFISWFSAFGLMEKTSVLPPHYEFYPIYKTFGNTFTYIRFLYDDFGLIGLTIISYLWGVMAVVVMRVFLKKFTFVRIALATMMTFSLFWSFYGFAWIHITHTIWRLFQLGLLDYYLRKRVPSL